MGVPRPDVVEGVGLPGHGVVEGVGVPGPNGVERVGRPGHGRVKGVRVPGPCGVEGVSVPGHGGVKGVWVGPVERREGRGWGVVPKPALVEAGLVAMPPHSLSPLEVTALEHVLIPLR